MRQQSEKAEERLALQWRLRDSRNGAAILLLPSLFAIFVLAYVFADDVSPLLLLAWAAIQFVLVVLLATLFAGFNPATAPMDQLRRRWTAVGVSQCAVTCAWMAIFPFVGPVAQPREMALLGIVATAVYCAVLIADRSSPKAASFHIVGLSASFAWTVWSIAGPQGWPTFLLIGVCGGVLLVAVWLQERNFKTTVRTETERRDGEATIRMLLNDYQEHTSDWLWTTDGEGALRDVGPRLATALSCEPAALEGQSFAALFRPCENRDQFSRHLAERAPFRDLLLELTIAGSRRFWRLTAHPREDGRMSGVARDVTDSRKAEEQIAFMAHFDKLTGLANRHRFDERLRGVLRGDDRARGDVALFCLDLDDFKAVNDTGGHLAGDAVLTEVARRLEAEVRPQDMVARLGGDEFAILIETRAGMGMLIERAHRFLAAVREPFEIDGRLHRVTTSVGIARCVDGESDAAELVRRADLALFDAKRKGRDRLAIFESGLDHAARERRELERDLREALAREELRLHYQPVMDLDQGKTTGYEALLRWHHPARGLIAPAEFLHIAEETGLIVPIGEWVIRQALTETAGWPGDFRIAINLSPTQVRDPQLVSQIARILHDSQIAPGRVEFEITEHVLMQEGEGVTEVLHRLKGLGTRIALDDFGTGYSSLSYLRRFPFDRLKIDRKFVEHISDDLGSQAIVSSITRLADALGMETTAEGIETRRQLDLLRKLGCQEAQGYLICEPAPATVFAGPEGVETSLGDQGAAVVDYRKAREEVLRRRGGKVA
ncbi:EAL domain-containing protein [Qipengyuania sp. XHP0207]|uniref:putative bifunctional diguanylate cyclase/phosphodiesterase n=1 Tax=Qipengyuania sp. XHP0207 TaxID=3038078 RepID=UPI00241D031C|nr:EAL domain-containing protein [Qipengyuania sp. XHP0207]MDG5748344.1 EAL domain-containing protein [Qipengyuania sp. XHP0207]